MHPLIRLALVIGLLYAAYCSFLFLVQRHILFPGRQIPAQATMPPPGIERLWVGEVEAWWLPPPGEKPAPAVIFAHGNAELIDHYPAQLADFSQMGMGVLLVEYPGYGRSAGTPSQQSITDAFVQAHDRLATREDVDPSRIVLFGRSLGGGAVCALAEQRPPAAIILLSTFTSVRALAPRFLAPGFLVRDPFDNRAVVASYPGPVLVVHGTRDRIVPYAHGQTLARAAQRGQLLTYEAGHNNCPPDWAEFFAQIQAFLRGCGILLEAKNLR